MHPLTFALEGNTYTENLIGEGTSVVLVEAVPIFVSRHELYEHNHNWFEEAFNQLSFWSEFFPYPEPPAPYSDAAFLAGFQGSSRSVITVTTAFLADFDGTSRIEHTVVDLPRQSSSLGFLFTALAGGLIRNGAAPFQRLLLPADSEIMEDSIVGGLPDSVWGTPWRFDRLKLSYLEAQGFGVEDNIFECSPQPGQVYGRLINIR